LGEDETFEQGLSSGKVGDTDGYTTIDSVKDINFNDNMAVRSEVNGFLNKYKNADVEHAVVITKSGKVYELTGTVANVNPEIIGINELEGSIGVHNHTIYEGFDRGDSFSREDLLFSAKYKTWKEHLTSGNRKEAFIYIGNLSEEDLYKAYEKARNDVRERAFNTRIPIEWEQEAICRELAKTLEGFKFYENL
jgi:hypothetical protein